jgi:hypothetical protein
MGSGWVYLHMFLMSALNENEKVAFNNNCINYLTDLFLLCNRKYSFMSSSVLVLDVLYLSRVS